MIASLGFAASQNAVSGFQPFVELSFSVQGKTLPADHGYGLLAAVVRVNPEIRLHSEISILTIPGFADKQGKIMLTEQSCLRIRVPIDKIPLVYRLAGKRISIGKHEIQIGIPEIYALRPSETLRARIVTIKGKDYTQPEAFLEAAKRKLTNLGLSGQVYIPVDCEGKPCRKTIKIQRFTVVGFTTEVSGLNDEDSIALQQWGIGGKRHMGCGYFLPKRG